MSEPEQEIEQLQEESDRLEEDIEQARKDWERKKSDAAVPGAVGDVTEMDEDSETPETDYPAKN